MNVSTNSTESDISTESRDQTNDIRPKIVDQTNEIRTKIVDLILEEPDIKEKLITKDNLNLSHKNYNKLRELISSYPSEIENKISYFKNLDDPNKSILLQSDNKDVINTFNDLVNKDPIWVDRVINEAEYLLKLNDRINDLTNYNLEIIKKKNEKKSTQSPQSPQSTQSPQSIKSIESTNPFRKGLPRPNKSAIGGRRKKMKNKSTIGRRRKKMKNKSTKIRTKQKT